MSNFSNQNRQLYVVENANQIVVGTTADGKKFIKYAKVGETVAANGALLRSPLIDPEKISYGIASTANYMARPVKKFEVTVGAHGKTVDPDTSVEYVIPGQEYLLRLRVKQYISLSDHDEYWKDGAVKGMNGMTLSAFYKAMAISLAKSTARDLSPMVNVYLKSETTATHTADADVPVIVDGKYTAPADPAAGHAYIAIIVTEAKQEHNVGLMPLRSVNIELYTDTVIKDGDEDKWGTVTSVTPTVFIDNGADMQDLEYVLEGERGSYYGEFDDPKTRIPVLKQVVESKKYDVLELHFWYEGSLMDSGKSEKNITIICPSTVARNADDLDTVADGIKDALEAALGITFETRSIA